MRAKPQNNWSQHINESLRLLHLGEGIEKVKGYLSLQGLTTSEFYRLWEEMATQKNLSLQETSVKMCLLSLTI